MFEFHQGLCFTQRYRGTVIILFHWISMNAKMNHVSVTVYTGLLNLLTQEFPFLWSVTENPIVHLPFYTLTGWKNFLHTSFWPSTLHTLSVPH